MSEARHQVAPDYYQPYSAESEGKSISCRLFGADFHPISRDECRNYQSTLPGSLARLCRPCENHNSGRGK